MAGASTSSRLRTLLASETDANLDVLAGMVEDLGHEVVARTTCVEEAPAHTARALPDLALVCLGHTPRHALALIAGIADREICPVVVVVDAADCGFVAEASRLGVFAAITRREPAEWANALEVVLRRFTDYTTLKEAFGRRATIERASGILMERHRITGEAAFELMRSHARNSNCKLLDLAHAVVAGHGLLSPQTQ